MWLEEISMCLKAQAFHPVRIEVCFILEIVNLIHVFTVHCSRGSSWWTCLRLKVTVKWGAPTQAWRHYRAEYFSPCSKWTVVSIPVDKRISALAVLEGFSHFYNHWPCVLSLPTAVLWWICVCVLLLDPDSFDESLEEPFSLPAPPFSSYKWVGPSWPARSSFLKCSSSQAFGLWPLKNKKVNAHSHLFNMWKQKMVGFYKFPHVSFVHCS